MRLFNSDCMKVLPNIEDHTVDMIFTDLPYGTTNNKWDSKLHLPTLWEQWKRILRPHGVVALWGQMPFTAELVMSNPKWFRYEWVVEKTHATGFLNANRMPLKAHESILIFYQKLPTYNPQKTKNHSPVHSCTKHTDAGSNYGRTKTGLCGGGSKERFPRDILRFKWDSQKIHLHPTQKSLDACEYFVKTYTNEGDIVLDNCMGSGTTGVACLNLKRKFIGIEKDKEIYELAYKRISEQLNRSVCK